LLLRRCLLQGRLSCPGQQTGRRKSSWQLWWRLQRLGAAPSARLMSQQMVIRRVSRLMTKMTMMTQEVMQMQAQNASGSVVQQSV
jgi:hypothetical protein